MTAEGAKKSREHGEEGAILVAVIWIVALISLVVTSLAAHVRAGVDSASVETDRVRTEMLLEGGLDVAAATLLAEQPTIADGRRRRSRLGGATLDIAIQDAAGLVDINRADPALLTSLISRVSGSEETGEVLAQRIIDKRSQMEQGEQAQKGPPPPAFSTLGELYGLEGADRNVIASLLPYLTLYSRDGKVALAAAPQQVLASLPGITPEDLSAMQALRKTNNFKTPQAEDVINRHQQFVSAEEGNVFIVEAEIVAGARLIAGTRLKATILLDRKGERPFHVMGWSW